VLKKREGNSIPAKGIVAGSELVSDELHGNHIPESNWAQGNQIVAQGLTIGTSK
jgi:hypothetical protein